jgi:hypothetical protein
MALLALSLPAAAEAEPADPAMCTYETYQWSIAKRRGVNRETVRKPYSEVAGDERDPNDPRCTVCSEDQADIDLEALGWAGLGTVKVCRHYKAKVEAALALIQKSGAFDLVELTGYRPGRTRGKAVRGLRTEMSNHAYGTAVDINAGYNGLYRRCNVGEVTPTSIARCKLGIGGRWDPEARPRKTVTKSGVVHDAFTRLVGWKWGGEIEGGIRDLMHFSLTGY